MPDQSLPEAAVELLAKRRWDRGWFDDQGMARWDEAKRRCIPGVRKALDEARSDLQAVAPAIIEQARQEERERLREAVEKLREQAAAIEAEFNAEGTKGTTGGFVNRARFETLRDAASQFCATLDRQEGSGDV